MSIKFRRCESSDHNSCWLIMHKASVWCQQKARHTGMSGASLVPRAVCACHRQRKSKPGRLWGTSIAGVGIGSLTFHSTFGHWKPFGRSIDYQLIALSSAALLRAAQDGVPKYVTAAAIALTPFQPLVVTSTNLAALEVCLPYLRDCLLCLSSTRQHI